ncbi:hypothetical protein ACB092_09G015600 [Castanea dentata]
MYGFYENILYNITSNDVSKKNFRWGRDDVEGMTIDISIISERDLHEMDNLDDCVGLWNGNEETAIASCACWPRIVTSRQRVVAEDEEAHIFEKAKPVASDDEIQPSGS